MLIWAVQNYWENFRIECGATISSYTRHLL